MAAGGRPVLVGGVVRDFLRARVSDSVPAPAVADIDIEVFGLVPSVLESVLRPFGATLVGRSFGVYKLRIGGRFVDVSLPRRERHRSASHNDVDVAVDGDMTFAEAASRRDFTVNAMGFDWVAQTFLDPFGGKRDMRAGVIRHVGPAFAEDPLRVFRAARFAVRFGYTIAPETVALCQGMDLKALSRERVWEELVRLMDDDAGLGLSWYRKLGCLVWYPELAALVGVPQDPVHHPEGDVWTHTCLVLSAMHEVPVPQAARLELQLAALCHDLGKSVTTAWRSGRWRALGHEGVGVAFARQLLSRIGCPLSMQTDILSLVKTHMAPMQLHAAAKKGTVSDAAIRRLACKVSIEKLLWLAIADQNGRGQVFDPEPPAVAWLRTRAQGLSVYRSAPQPLIQGRDLVALGVVPGPQMGVLLKRLFQAQIRGVFSTKEEGLSLLGRFIGSKGQS
jgi:tRNA nucleotidyltransferase (CCA-adding enzyme)